MYKFWSLRRFYFKLLVFPGYFSRLFLSVINLSKMFTLGQEHMLEEASKPQPIMFTAGAVPVKNRKGMLRLLKC